MFTVKFANLEVGVSKSHSASMLQAGYWISALVASIIHSSHALATLHSMFYDGKHKIFGEICFLHALLAGHRSLTGDHFSWARSVCTVTEGVMDWFCRINIVKFWKARPRPRTYIFLPQSRPWAEEHRVDTHRIGNQLLQLSPLFWRRVAVKFSYSHILNPKAMHNNGNFSLIKWWRGNGKY